MIRAGFPNGNFPAESQDLYGELLVDLPFQAVKEALHRRMLSEPSGFLPTVGEIRQSVAEVAIAAPSVEEAWGLVLAEVHRVGYMGSPRFAYPQIPAALRALGGWPELCASENQVADRAHFMRIYGAIREKAIRDRNLSTVPGLGRGASPELPASRVEPKSVVALPPAEEVVAVARAKAKDGS